MTLRWTPTPLSLRVRAEHPGAPLDWLTRVRIRRLPITVCVARILRCDDDGRLRYRGWYARTHGCGGSIAAVLAYYNVIESAFGSDVHGVRGYGRTRDEAVGFLRVALLRGWMGSGALYAPPQMPSGYTSEYEL